VKSVTILCSVIRDALFQEHTSLKNVTLGNKVTTINAKAFHNCSGIQSIDIPNSVTLIGYQAFEGCTGLTSIILPNSIKTIGNYVFRNCTGLTSVTLPNNTEDFRAGVFYGCSKLTEVYCPSKKVPVIGDDVFANTPIESATLYVPKSAIDAYKAADQWKDFGNIVAIEGGIDKCATPTITVVNGGVRFDCETEGARFISEVKCVDIKNSDEEFVPFNAVYTVRVHATAEGYEDSDEVVETINLSTTSDDYDGDGLFTINDIAEFINKYLNSTDK
jgi:hypothetical protein